MPDLISLRKKLHNQKHRQLVILSGSKDWQKKQLTSLYQANETVFWVSSQAKKPNEALTTSSLFSHFDYEFIEAKRLPYYLGQEISGAIIDVHEGISADSLGIVSGMIKAGGLFILLTPDIQSWKKLTNPENSRFLSSPLTLEQANSGFTQHLIKSWQQNNVVWLQENQTPQPLLASVPRISAPSPARPPIAELVDRQTCHNHQE